MIANVEEAAIGFSGRISRNGLLPWPEPVKKIVEGDDRCGAARVAGVTLRGAGLGGAFRGISPAEPSLSGLASELSESAKGWAVTAEDGPIGPTLVVESSGSALKD